MTEEIWKDIEGYEGLYQVSNQGRIKSLKYGKENILKPGTDKDGYLYVNLCKDAKTKSYKVHRLVAQAFIPNPDNKPQINHKSEEKWLNTVDNLEWATAKENTNWGGRNKCISQKLINNSNESKPVKQLSLDGALVTIWPSTRETQRNGFNQGAVCACCNGKSKTHKGFKWEYA